MSTIISIILLLASVGIFFGYINPTYTNAQNLSSQLGEYEQALSNSKQLLAERDTLISKLNTFNQGDIDKLQTLLPDSVDSVTLIIEIDSIASQFGMHIRDFTTSDQGQTGALGVDTSPYGTLSLTFTTTASYPTFVAFLKALENNLRLIDVDSITFSSSSNNSVYDFTLGVNTYWLK
jgi:hypothetical protein